eukprot:Trichotokara_eunicae@DN264_c0_g1_i1.p1
MKFICSQDSITIPDTVEITVFKRVVSVKGKYGTIVRSFKHVQCEMRLLDTEKPGCCKELLIRIWFGTNKQCSAIRTVLTHVKNMITGVTKMYLYKMRTVHAHFPINTKVHEKKDCVEVNNFLGDKKVRVIRMASGVTIEKSKDAATELILKGVDVEAVGKSAALLHQSCLVRNKDIRQFLDGVYVSERTTVDVDEE